MATKSIAELYAQYVNRKAMLTVLDYPEYKKRVVQPDGDTKEEVVPAAVGINIPVFIADARQGWGREYLLVRPVRGEGSTWVEAGDRVRVLRDDEDWPDEEDHRAIRDEADEAPFQD